MPDRGRRCAPDNPRLYPGEHSAPGETVMRTHGNKEFWLAALRADGPAFRAAVAEAAPDAPVPSCPEWTVAQLTGHLAGIYRWVTDLVRRGVAGPPEVAPPGAPAAGAGEVDARIAALVGGPAP